MSKKKQSPYSKPSKPSDKKHNHIQQREPSKRIIQRPIEKGEHIEKPPKKK